MRAPDKRSPSNTFGWEAKPLNQDDRHGLLFIICGSYHSRQTASPLSYPRRNVKLFSSLV